MKLIKLAPNEIKADPDYQRDLDQRRVDAMAKDFQPNLIGVPPVSKRTDGSYWVIDGQHRIKVLIAVGKGDVPISVEAHEGLSQCEEAQMFLRLNQGRKAIKAINRFKTRLVAEDPVAIDIKAILKKVGCRITTGKQKGGVSAIEAVEFAYYKANLESTMRALFAWLDGDPDAFDNGLIRGVSIFFAACVDADPVYLARKLQEQSPMKIRSRMKREAQQHDSKADAAKFVLIDVYNKRTPASKRVGHKLGVVAA